MVKNVLIVPRIPGLQTLVPLPGQGNHARFPDDARSQRQPPSNIYDLEGFVRLRTEGGAAFQNNCYARTGGQGLLLRSGCPIGGDAHPKGQVIYIVSQ